MVTLENVSAHAVGDFSYGADIAWCDNVSISGGTFYSEQNSALRFVDGNAVVENATINTPSNYDALLTQNDAAVSITGGTYSFDVSGYVNTNTHTITENSDGTYTVSQK